MGELPTDRQRNGNGCDEGSGNRRDQHERQCTHRAYIILTALDGATDYIQTRGLVELLPERYLKADSSRTQTTHNFSMKNSDAQKFYIVGI